MQLTILLVIIIVIFVIIFGKKWRPTIFNKNNKYQSLDDAFNERKYQREQEIDRLLSKIGKNGLKDLSKKERKRLDELSNK